MLASLTGIAAQVAFADADLRGHWQMDDGVDFKIADSSGHGNDGQARDIRWAEGVLNSGLQVNSGGTVDCGNDASLNITDAISIDAWLKPWRPRYPDQPTMLRKEGAYALHLGPGKQATFTLWLNGKETRVSADLTEWPAGQWRYFAGTFDGSSMKIYVNGTLANEKQIGSGQKIATNQAPVNIGSVKA